MAAKRRTYDHYCSLAQALDVIGDRWAPLIVRELLLGPRRFTDLQNGLPGIASDMLTTRLREMSRAGLVEKVALEPPASGSAYRLTELGRGLDEPLVALARWGLDLMPPPSDAGAFTPSILAASLRVVLVGDQGEPMVVQLRSRGEAYAVEIDGSRVVARQGSVDDPDLTIEGEPGPILAVVVGGVEPGESTGDEWDAAGVRVDGAPAALERLRAMVSVPERLRTPVSG